MDPFLKRGRKKNIFEIQQSNFFDIKSHLASTENSKYIEFVSLRTDWKCEKIKGHINPQRTH